MRYQGAEKLEIIRLVERSHLPVRWTLDQIGIPCATFYRWYDLYRTGGPEALEDRPSHPGRVWNRIPDEIRDQRRVARSRHIAVGRVWRAVGAIRIQPRPRPAGGLVLRRSQSRDGVEFGRRTMRAILWVFGGRLGLVEQW